MPGLVYVHDVVAKKVVHGFFTDEPGVEGYRDGFKEADELAPLLDRYVGEGWILITPEHR
jgi:hypothetical protein